jgi:hypothetical protein
MKKFYTASKKRRPYHPRPRTGYEGNPSSVFKTPTPATTHCVKQPMEHVWEKATRARGPSTLTWRCFLRVPTHVRRGIRPRGHIHDRIEHQHTTRLGQILRAFILRAIVCRAPNVSRAIVCQASTVRRAIVCQASTVHRANVCDKKKGV